MKKKCQELKEFIPIIALYILFFIFISVIFNGGGWATSEIDAKRTLDSAGYTNPVFIGHSWFVCNNLGLFSNEYFATKFKATNPNGKEIEGTVCSSLFFKSATIRY